MAVKGLDYRVTLLKEYPGAPLGTKTWLVDPFSYSGEEYSNCYPLRDVLSKLSLDSKLNKYAVCDEHKTDDGYICLAPDGTVKREWRGSLSPANGIYITPISWEVVYKTMKHPGKIVIEGGNIKKADIRYRDIGGAWILLLSDVAIPGEFIITPLTITGIRITVKETNSGYQRPRLRNLALHADTTTLKSEIISLRLLLSSEKTSMIPQWGSIQTGAFDMVVKDPGWTAFPYQLPIRFEIGLPNLTPIMLGFVDNWEKKEVGGSKYWKVDGRDVLKLAKESTVVPSYRYNYTLGELFSYLIDYLGVNGVNEVGTGKQIKWAMFDNIWSDLGNITAAVQGRISAVDDSIYLKPVGNVPSFTIYDSDLLDRPEQKDVVINKINIESIYYGTHNWVNNHGASSYWVIGSNQVYDMDVYFYNKPSDPDNFIFGGLFLTTGEFYSDNYTWQILSSTSEQCIIRVTTGTLINPNSIVHIRTNGRIVGKKSITRVIEDKQSQAIWGAREAPIKLKYLESGVEVENLAYAVMGFYSGIARYKLSLTLKIELKAGDTITWKDKNYLVASVEHSLPACITTIEIEEIKPWEVISKLLKDISSYRRTGVTANRYYIAGHLGGGVATTQAVAANTIYAMPFICSQGVNIDALLLEVTLLSAGNARIGIYSDENIHPKNLVLNIGEVSTGTTGVKNRSLNQNLSSNMLYWFVVQFSGTPTVRAVAKEYVLPLIGAGETLGADIIPTCWTVSRAYADGLPAVMPTMTTSNISIPALALRVSNYI